MTGEDLMRDFFQFDTADNPGKRVRRSASNGFQDSVACERCHSIVGSRDENRLFLYFMLSERGLVHFACLGLQMGVTLIQ